MYRSDSELAMSIGHIGKAPLRYRFPIRRPPPIYPYHNAPYHELIAPAPGAMYYGPYYGVSPGYVPPYVGYRGMVPAGRLMGADEVINPSLRPYPNFNVFEDCERLHQAMKGYGVDEKAIIDVIGNRSVDQRLRIVEHYRLMYGKDLVKEFRTVLSGHFFDCIEALLFPPQDLDAVELRKAIRGAGTDEDTLTEILYTRSNAQIKLIKEAYKRIFLGRDLETDIRNSTCGHFRAFLLTQLENVRDESESVDWNLAHDDAVKLYEAADRRNISVQQQLLDLLSTRSPAHMRCVFDAYARVANKEIEVAMEQHVSGELLRSYVGLIRCVRNKPNYFAARLNRALKGIGTDDNMLIRIIVTRCEVDMGRILHEYFTEYGKTLSRSICDDTSGDYQRLLLTLIAEDKRLL